MSVSESSSTVGPRFTPLGAGAAADTPPGDGGGAATGDDFSVDFASAPLGSASPGEADRDGGRGGGAGAREGGAGGFGRREGGAGATTGGTGLKPCASGARLRDGAGGGPLGRARCAAPGFESVSARGDRDGDGGWDGGTDERPDGRGGDGFLGELSSSAMTFYGAYTMSGRGSLGVFSPVYGPFSSPSDSAPGRSSACYHPPP
jgi:hypothetical protein